MMTVEFKKLPKALMRQFTSDIGATEFFSYVGNMVTIEQALAVIGVLKPDFVERGNCVFWRANADEYDPEKYPMKGLKVDEHGALVLGSDRSCVERYRNNFPINQFFGKWEGGGDGPIFKTGLSEGEHELCRAFAEQLVVYWGDELRRQFPNRNFAFEVGDDLLDEYGVCMTFWQI